MNPHPGVDFINVLCAPFLYECLFLVRFGKKALSYEIYARKTLMKLTAGWEFTKLLTQILNIFCNFGPSNLEITMSLSSF